MVRGWNCNLRTSKNMPNKKELELLNDSYIDSIKNNLRVIRTELQKKKAAKRDLFTSENVEKLAEHGVPSKALAGLFGHLSSAITQNPELFAAYNRGRAKIGSQVRASIVDDALNKDMPYAKLHLDKVLNKEDNSIDVNLNVKTSPLDAVPTDELLEVMFKQIENND